ncbi:hypothetical protein DFQ27_003172 [Actinomortierella ambigua]|uniref:Vacuolar membrane protein n=1 Tax=Actinomortierella ambigua TaxID=1343610 RepID=A0A9P6Q6J0_9FUNG|nr:hypothetical protein DFQ27_003172 [Actinomortierella ambigua]
MSANEVDWKRQKVEDHKFDFIDVEDYVDSSWWRQVKYSVVFIVVIKGILIYCADVWTAVNLILATNLQQIAPGVGKNETISGIEGLDIDLNVYKWIFMSCIVLSFVLLAWDIKRAVEVIKSRDISYAFTSMIASRYYCITSYAHFCLFEKIHQSKKSIDEVAFFCFFTFRGWKRLLFADAPRQVINAYLLYNIFFSDKSFSWKHVWATSDDTSKKFSIGVMMFTVTMFTLSILYMLVAVFLYIPLVLHIRGNLKEYCCHKIDKRIDEIVKKKARSRAQEAAKNGGDLPKATLPNIGLIEGSGRSSPAPGAGPRPAYANYKPPGSPQMRKNMPLPNDPYRRQHTPQHPPRAYSPAPPARCYTPTLDDDIEHRPLKHDNHQQHYHNRNMRQQGYDYADDRSEISDVQSGVSGSHMGTPRTPANNYHRRHPSESSTVISGSNQGSVVNGYGSPARGVPAGQPRPYYAETVMMTDMSGRGQQAPPYGAAYQDPYQSPGRVTGLGGGVGPRPGGSVVGGGSTISGPTYSQQQRSRMQQPTYY